MEIAFVGYANNSAGFRPLRHIANGNESFLFNHPFTHPNNRI